MPVSSWPRRSQARRRGFLVRRRHIDGASKGKIVTIGEILVDIIALERGRGFREPLALSGPYPGGAPAIFAAQVGRLGHPVGIISCVGDDDFGWLNIERLQRDGVDVSAVKIHDDHVTASAFLRYREDGDRDFLFNLKRSAAGQIALDAPARKLLEECGHFHVMGSSLFSFHIVDEVKKAMEIVKARGGTVSFDPNIRKEMLDIPEMRAALEFMLQFTDIFLPSGPELLLPTEAKTEAEAIEALFALGVSRIVIKRSARVPAIATARWRSTCRPIPSSRPIRPVPATVSARPSSPACARPCQSPIASAMPMPPARWR